MQFLFLKFMNFIWELSLLDNPGHRYLMLFLSIEFHLYFAWFQTHWIRSDKRLSSEYVWFQRWQSVFKSGCIVRGSVAVSVLHCLRNWLSVLVICCVEHGWIIGWNAFVVVCKCFRGIGRIHFIWALSFPKAHAGTVSYLFESAILCWWEALVSIIDRKVQLNLLRLVGCMLVYISTHTVQVVFDWDRGIVFHTEYSFLHWLLLYEHRSQFSVSFDIWTVSELRLLFPFGIFIYWHGILGYWWFLGLSDLCKR